MTAFVIVCAAMVLVAVVWIGWPLLRPAPDVDVAGTRTERRVVIALLVIALPVAAGVLYATLSSWRWNDPELEQTLEISAEIRDLQAQLRRNPRDVEGWTQLGRTYVAMRQFAHAVTAFENANRAARGADPDVTASLAEALTLSDENALDGRAGQLFEAVLARAPGHPKALFYSSIGALRAGKLPLARERLQMLLARDPPPQIRPMLERQIQDIDEQLRAGPQPDAVRAAAAKVSRRVKVAVSVAPQIHDQIREQLREPLSLFILARDPAGGGPPLAVERHSSGELPLTVELSEADAMLPTHTIGSVDAVQIVARLSRSGTPQQQSGDYYGEAQLQFDANTAEYAVSIVIDRRVP